MKNFNTAEFESKTKQAVSGIPLGANMSIDQVSSRIVQNTLSENTIRNIQQQIASAKQSMIMDL